MFLQIKPLLCTKTHCIQHSWHKPATPKTTQKQGKAGVPRRQNDAKPQVGPRTGTRRMFCPFCESLTTGRGYDGLLLSSQDVQCQLNSSPSLLGLCTTLSQLFVAGTIPLSLLVAVPPSPNQVGKLPGAVTGSVSCVAYLRLSSFLVERSASPYPQGVGSSKEAKL